MSYGILTPGLVREAYEMVFPMIEATLKNHAKRQDLAVVVTTTSAILHRDTNKMLIKDNCLLFAAIGDISEWEYPYGDIALSKADKSARTGRNTAELPPHYLIDHDVVYWGSVVLDDIVVACSGVEPYYDEMISMWLAAAIKALCKKRFAELKPEQMFIK